MIRPVHSRALLSFDRRSSPLSFPDNGQLPIRLSCGAFAGPRSAFPLLQVGKLLEGGWSRECRRDDDYGSGPAADRRKGARFCRERCSVGVAIVVKRSAGKKSVVGEASGNEADLGQSDRAHRFLMPLDAFDEADPRVLLLKELADQAGVFIYDVTLPQGRSGVMQVVIASASRGPSEVGHEQCNRMARLILDHERVEELLPGSVTLEVSSPGVNRDLRCLRQLEGAVGERVRVVVRDFRFPSEADGRASDSLAGGAASRAGVIRGLLESVGSGSMRMIDESRRVAVEVALSDLKEARVDFAFDDEVEPPTPVG